MWIKGIVAALCCFIVVCGEEGAPRSPYQLIKAAGFSAEEHTVFTPDGYILTLHRIPNIENNYEDQSERKTVFIQHGLLGSSADFLIAGRERGLAFILAELGYDVWLGNFRGNTYSRRHISLTANELSFWDFDWELKGTIDLPAMIDFVLKRACVKKIDFVGHSIGASAFLVMNSMKPEYNEKFRTAHLMSPIAHLWCSANFFLRNLNCYYNPLEDIIGYGEFKLGSAAKDLDSYRYCKEQGKGNTGICENAFFQVLDITPWNLNKTLIPEILTRYPAGGSTAEIIHLAQEKEDIKNGFRRFDFGEEDNLKTYGSRNPPNYDLSKVTAKIALYFSEDDYTAPEHCVEELKDDLPNVMAMHRVEVHDWSYSDFLWGNYVDQYVYFYIEYYLSVFK